MAAVAAVVRDRWGEHARVLVVEPDGASCWPASASARAGRLVRVPGGRTALGRLDCPEPSLLAWQLLSRLAEASVTVTDEQADHAADFLAASAGTGTSGCGAAGAGGLLAVTARPAARAAMGLDHSSRVLLVATEAATQQ